MKTLQIEVDIPADRQLTIQLPEDVEPGKHQVVVVMQPQDLKAEREGGQHHLNELAGQVTSFVEVDAMTWQRQIRDEWDED